MIYANKTKNNFLGKKKKKSHENEKVRLEWSKISQNTEESSGRDLLTLDI